MMPSLRRRKSNAAPVGDYSLGGNKKDKKLFIMKKTIVKKKEAIIINGKKQRLRICDDALLDMFRFFKRQELCSFMLVNRRMKRVVELGDQKKQLRQRFVFCEIVFLVCLQFTPSFPCFIL
jgi:hypothetical protein